MKLAEKDIQTITNKLINQAYLEIGCKYGINSTDPKPYHNDEHSKDVVEASGLIADKAIAAGKMSIQEKLLLLIAAAFHDYKHDKDNEDNEAESAKTVAKLMQATNAFSEAEIAKVHAAIMGTKVRFIEGIMKQSASDNYLDQALADADLANLGSSREKYWDRSMKLCKELYPDEYTDNKSVSDFAERQVSVLEHHVYYTPEALLLFPHQANNLTYTRSFYKA